MRAALEIFYIGGSFEIRRPVGRKNLPAVLLFLPLAGVIQIKEFWGQLALINAYFFPATVEIPRLRFIHDKTAINVNSLAPGNTQVGDYLGQAA